MKKSIILFLVLIIQSTFGFTQSIENLDYISPFNEGFAAIQKDGQWAFINKEGTIVIGFRNDLVVTNSANGSFPIFKNGRCLIEEKKDGISYFGYISTCGNTVIEPQYLNAKNFNDGFAMVLELIKENVGRNLALGKNIVYDKYLVAIIDTKGAVKTYVSPTRTNVILDNKFLKAPPEIRYKYISKNVFAFKGENKKWTVINVSDNYSAN